MFLLLSSVHVWGGGTPVSTTRQDENDKNHVTVSWWNVSKLMYIRWQKNYKTVNVCALALGFGHIAHYSALALCTKTHHDVV